MQRILPTLALVLVTTATLAGCADGADNGAAKITPSPTPTPSPIPTIVVKRYRADDSGGPELVLGAIKRARLSVEPEFGDLSGTSEPFAVVSSASIDAAADRKVCGVVKNVYEGAVIRKVGGIDTKAATTSQDHTVVISLPMPVATPSPAPAGETRC